MATSLKNLSAADVQNIEVYLKNASKYDVSDKAGLIKIKTNI
jgi:hypothetical protein